MLYGPQPINSDRPSFYSNTGEPVTRYNWTRPSRPYGLAESGSPVVREGGERQAFGEDFHADPLDLAITRAKEVEYKYTPPWDQSIPGASPLTHWYGWWCRECLWETGGFAGGWDDFYEEVSQCTEDSTIPPGMTLTPNGRRQAGYKGCRTRSGATVESHHGDYSRVLFSGVAFKVMCLGVIGILEGLGDTVPEFLGPFLAEGFPESAVGLIQLMRSITFVKVIGKEFIHDIWDEGGGLDDKIRAKYDLIGPIMNGGIALRSDADRFRNLSSSLATGGMGNTRLHAYLLLSLIEKLWAGDLPLGNTNAKGQLESAAKYQTPETFWGMFVPLVFKQVRRTLTANAAERFVAPGVDLRNRAWGELVGWGIGDRECVSLSDETFPSKVNALELQSCNRAESINESAGLAASYGDDSGTNFDDLLDEVRVDYTNDLLKYIENTIMEDFSLFNRLDYWRRIPGVTDIRPPRVSDITARGESSWITRFTNYCQGRSLRRRVTTRIMYKKEQLACRA